jgi:hypothetical protein
MPRVIVCDVNETLLDIGALEPHFKQASAMGVCCRTGLLVAAKATVRRHRALLRTLRGTHQTRLAASRLRRLSASPGGGVCQSSPDTHADGRADSSGMS